MTPTRSVQGIALAIVVALTPGCGLIIGAARGAFSSSGGPLTESMHVTGTTWGAVPRRPLSCGNSAASPMHVYAFVAPRSATYTFESTTSDYDGVIAVYDPNGSELACNDDYQSTRSSQVVVTLSEGQTVEVIQGGYSGASGHYELWSSGSGGSSGSTLTLADGTVVDVPASPPQPLALATMVQGDTRGQPAILGIDCPPASSMQEWTFTATESASYLFQVDAQYDAFLGVLESDDGIALGCNDDWMDTNHSRVAAALVAGETYRVIVGGFSQQSGAYSLTAVPLTSGGALTVQQPVLFESGGTDAEPDVCGAPAGSVDRAFTFTPRAEAFYSFYADVTGLLVVDDGRSTVACLPLSPDRRSGLLLKARHRYSIVIELGVPDGMAHALVVDRVDPAAPDWQVPPSVPPISAMLTPH
jgi:hypothetical protein